MSQIQVIVSNDNEHAKCVIKAYCTKNLIWIWTRADGFSESRRMGMPHGNEGLRLVLYTSNS
jgi:hypothetical protein